MAKAKKKETNKEPIAVPEDIKSFVAEPYTEFVDLATRLGMARFDYLSKEGPILQAMAERQTRFNERATDVAKRLGLDPDASVLDLTTMTFRPKK